MIRSELKNTLEAFLYDIKIEKPGWKDSREKVSGKLLGTNIEVDVVRDSDSSSLSVFGDRFYFTGWTRWETVFDREGKILDILRAQMSHTARQSIQLKRFKEYRSVTIDRTSLEGFTRDLQKIECLTFEVREDRQGSGRPIKWEKFLHAELKKFPVAASIKLFPTKDVVRLVLKVRGKEETLTFPKSEYSGFPEEAKQKFFDMLDIGLEKACKVVEQKMEKHWADYEALACPTDADNTELAQAVFDRLARKEIK